MSNRRMFYCGQQFGNLTFIEEVNGVQESDRIRRYFKLKCICGKIIICSYDTMLKKGSCGCKYKYKRTHNLYLHPIYRHWSAMKYRCYNKNHAAYFRYGGSGIRVCKEWKKSFQLFYDWAVANGWKKGLQLDRFPNNKGGYSPSNCRWATRSQNQNNRSICTYFTYKGVKGTIAELSRIFNFTDHRIRKRVKVLGYTISEAIEWIPSDHVNSHKK